MYVGYVFVYATAGNRLFCSAAQLCLRIDATADFREIELRWLPVLVGASMSVTPQNELVQNLQTLDGKVPSAMQVFSGIYLNFARPAAVAEKTVFLQKSLTCFRRDGL